MVPRFDVKKLFVACVAIAALALVATPLAAAEPNPLIEKGLKQLKKGQFGQAEKSFKKAVAAEEGPCGVCQLGLAMVYSRTDEWKKGEKAARQAIAQLGDDPQQYLAHHELGKICMHRKKPSYDCAEEAFRAAIEGGKAAAADSDRPANSVTKAESEFYLGMALLKQSKDEAGVAALQSFVEGHPNSRYVATAQSLIAEPIRARKNLVPAFEWRTLRGKSLSSEDIAGKVVLLDFWATWCKPCINAVPSLRDLAEKYEDDPFVLVSLSVDSSEGKVRDFIRKHTMKWPQVWDRERWGRTNLRVSKFPTYIIVGADGEILHRYSGGGGGIERRLERDVGRAVRAAKKAAKKKS